MVKAPGKQFEEDFKKSVPSNCWIYRFKDGTANFNGARNENVRFQAYNICDFLVMSNRLNLFELKSHKGQSIPFSAIRLKQVEELSKIQHEKINSYFVFNFRDFANTYCVQATKVKEFMETSTRKSIPLSWCEEHGIKIEQQKKKVTWRYDLKGVLELE